MFVSAREEGNSPNTQCMGLLLGKYVPRQALASPDWRGLPKEAEALEGMFTTYITSPLCATAVPSRVRAAPLGLQGISCLPTEGLLCT